MISEQNINKGLIIAGGLLGLGLLGYVLFRGKKEITEDAEFTIVDEPQCPKSKPPVSKKKSELVVDSRKKTPIQKQEKTVVVKPEVLPEPNDDFPLKLGSQGERVRQLQVYLLKNHGTAGLVNDVFETVTQERVLKFLKVKEVSEALFLERNMANLKNKKTNGRKKKH